LLPYRIYGFFEKRDGHGRAGEAIRHRLAEGACHAHDFFFHCARFFDRDGWHVKNPELSFGFTVFVAVVDQFIMPLFFSSPR